MGKHKPTPGDVIKAWRLGRTITPDERDRRIKRCVEDGRDESVELTQDAAALLVGIDQATWCRLEAGVRPRPPLLFAVARLVGVDAESLYGGES